MTPARADRAVALLQTFELLEQLDKLKALHRAGESPSYGQVEALFDQAAAVRAALHAPDPSRPAPWPTSCHPTPLEQTARRLVELVAAQVAGRPSKDAA
jgi:hypothetical protein